jgi:SAM-dependent methyltransferase
MDDFAMEGEILQDALDKIATINQFLGGNRLTLHGVQKLIADIDQSQEITIVDLGCGNGDMLRKLADYANKKSLNFKLIGVDANNFTIKYAKELSINYTNIEFKCLDIFDQSFQELKCDIALLTLTLHHFKDTEIMSLLTTWYKNVAMGIVINDLHRNEVAYRLFQGLGWLIRLNKMPKEDGLTSILRGFKKEELISFSKKLNCKKYNIQWKWAFRYQWIIQKI